VRKEHIKIMKNVLAKSKPETQSPAAALLALTGRRVELDTQRRAVVDGIIRLEKLGERETFAAISPNRKEAVKLLNGSAGGMFDPDPSSPRITLKALREKLGVIDEALALAEKLENDLAIKAERARWDEYGQEYAAAMGGVAAAVLGLEHALQARDRVLAKIRPSRVLAAGQGVPFMGRLKNGGSSASRFLQVCAAQGWIRTAEFEKAVKEARNQ
jgi:hypothetical protein